jgi:membrane protease YdiL (CAAX protease family)
VLPATAWRIESVVRLVAFVFIGIFAANLVMKLADDWLTANISDKLFLQHVVSFACLQGMALLWVTAFLREHGTNWVDGFGLSRAPLSSVGLGLVTVCVAIPVAMIVIGGLIIELLKQFGIEPAAQTTVTMIQHQADTAKTAVLAAAATVLAPIAEETFFRGILYPAIKHRGHPNVALWSTALLFGIVHGNLGAFIPLTFLALVFTWLYERTGNLLAPIVAHSVFNGVNFWFLVSPPEWFKALQQ